MDTKTEAKMEPIIDVKAETKKQEDLASAVDSSQIKEDMASPSEEDEAEEINKIMNEIKELQQEIETEEKDPAVRSEVIHIASVSPKSAPPDRAPAPKTESVRHLSEVRAEKSTTKHSEKEDSTESSDSMEEGGELAMTIRGSLTLKLNYGDDQFVKVSFKTNELSFQLSDGAEFKLPIHIKQSAGKKLNHG